MTTFSNRLPIQLSMTVAGGYGLGLQWFGNHVAYCMFPLGGEISLAKADVVDVRDCSTCILGQVFDCCIGDCVLSRAGVV